MDCLLRPGWKLADYSIQLDRLNARTPKTVFNLGILYTSVLADPSPGRVVAVAAAVHYR